MGRRRKDYSQPVGHPDDCMCAPCLLEDLNRHLVDQGQDPADYPVLIPGPGGRWRVVRPESAAALIAAAEDRPNELAEDDEIPQVTPATVNHAAGRGVPSSVLEAEEAAFAALVANRRRSEAVPVRVADLGAGVWAHFAIGGPDAAMVVAGAVVAGPDVVPGTDRLALLVDSYRGGPPVAVVVPWDAYADLVDDPADHAARGRHALAPKFGAVSTAYVLVRQTPRRSGDRPWWRLETVAGPDADTLAGLETPGGSGRLLHSARRDTIHVPDGVLSDLVGAGSDG